MPGVSIVNRTTGAPADAYAQAIITVTPGSISFVGPVADGTVLAAVGVTLSAGPAFSGGLFLTGADAAHFRLSSTTLPANILANGTVANGTYHFNLFVSQGGISNSPQTQAVIAIGAAANAGLFPTITSNTAQDLGTIMTPWISSPAGHNPMTRYAQVISGTVTLDVFGWQSNGAGATPPNGSVVMEWLIDGVSFGSGYITGPPFTFSWNTTGVADGTHIIYARFVDAAASNNFPAYLMFNIPLLVIVQNHGAISGAQTVPTADFGFNINIVPTTPDFVTYPGSSGLPFSNPVHAYPVQTVTASNSASLRNPANWYIERTTVGDQYEYESNPRWFTTQNGGIYAGGFNYQSGNDVATSYAQVILHQNYDGGRCDSMLDPYTNFCEAPDGSAWYFCDLAYRIGKIDHAGVITTVFGVQNNRNVLPYDWKDTTLTQTQVNTRNNFVGTTSGFTFAFPGASNDLCVDPNNSDILYYCVVNGHAVIKVVLSTQVASIYAGIHGSPGYVDNSNPLVAQFNQPFSIQFVGTDMYVADQVNDAIRKIAQVSPGVAGAVTTLCGGTVGPTPPSLATAVEFSSITGTIDNGSGSPGNILTVTAHSGLAIAIGQEVVNPGNTVGLVTLGTTITSFISGSGDTGTYGVSGAAQLVASNPLQCANVGLYSQPTSVAFAAAYTVAPQVLRKNSAGNLVLGEAWSQCVRLINLSTGQISRIGAFTDAASPDVNNYWLWLDCDYVGTCGPVDDIIVFKSDSQGSAETGWRLSLDGTYSAEMWGPSDYTPPDGRGSLGARDTAGHYPWAIAFSRLYGRFITNGFADGGAFSWRILQGSDPAYNFASNIGIEPANYNNGRNYWDSGTAPGFPWGSRPSFRALMGPTGNGHLGNGIPTYDDLMVSYPTDPALAAWIQGGGAGVVPRPELVGNVLRDLIYWIRRTTLAGSYPTIVGLGGSTAGTPPVISEIYATRLDTTSIKVNWTTDQASLGLAAAGSANAVGSAAPYAQYSPPESSYGTSHSAVISGLPTSTPIHYSVLAQSNTGFVAYSPDATIL